MASDWVKARDSAFQRQACELIAIIATHHALWGLTQQDMDALQQCLTGLDTAMAEQAAQATLYHAAVADKQTRRNRLEQALRAIVRRINNHPGMTDELRREMHLASPTRNASGRGESTDHE